MNYDHVLFLSLRPRFADAVLSGDKTVELRRARPSAPSGTIAVVYAATPRRAVVGICVVDNIRTGSPDAIWQRHRNEVGIVQSEYDAYFSGAEQAVAIALRDPQPLPRPIPLQRVRSVWGPSMPPQSFRYVPTLGLTALGIAVDKPRRRRAPVT